MVNEDTSEDDSNFIELELLSNLVADYSEENFVLGNPQLSDVMKLRMYEMGLNQAKLSELLGVSQSRISGYLMGKSKPTLKVARDINKRLNINPEIILGI